jgi:hypothetical protein
MGECYSLEHLFRLVKTEIVQIMGGVLGLLPIAIMEIAYYVSLSLSIQRCPASACASSGLPPGYTVGEFGCNEWSGPARFMFFASGMIALLYAIIAGIMAYLVTRKERKAAAGSQAPDPGG